MSDIYKKTIRKTLSKTVSYSGSVSYPASENGGSTSYNGTKTAYIDVEINTYLDNRPVVRSVNSCENHVDGLTASVVATEAAEIKAKRDSSKKVAGSIIRGFFGLIKSEISQQMAELKIKTESELLHLQETAKNCLAKKKQMEKDFHRIAERYGKIFSELNSELDNRIHELDKPVFIAGNNLFSQISKLTDDGGSSVYTVFGADQSELQSNLLVSNVKKKTFEIINQIKQNLKVQRKVDSIIEENTYSSSNEKQFFMPVCYVEYNDASNYQNTFLPFQIEEESLKKIDSYFGNSDINWNTISDEHKVKLSSNIAKEINAKLNHTDENYNRLLNTFNRIAKLDSLLTN